MYRCIIEYTLYHCIFIEICTKIQGKRRLIKSIHCKRHLRLCHIFSTLKMKDYLSCRLEFLHTTLFLVDKKDSEQLKEENVQNALQVMYAKP